MHKFLAAAAILLAGMGLANADEFFAAASALADKTPPPKTPPPKIDPGKLKPNMEPVVSITKVDGDKIYVTRTMVAVGKKTGEPEILVAAESCKVIMRGKIDPATRKFEETLVEEGLKNKLFKKATVSARITMDGDKVAQIVILNVMPDNEFRAMVKKVDGQKITFMKMPTPGMGPIATKPGGDMTLTAVDKVKVLEYSLKDRNKEPTPVADGLKNQAFSRAAMVLIVTDDDNNITEIRLNPPPPMGGGGFRPPPPPPPPPPAPK